MYSITKSGDSVQYGIYEAVVNTKADLATLPTTWDSGSICICLEDASVYMLSNADENGDKIWTEL